jgi:hypothetical protein
VPEEDLLGESTLAKVRASAEQEAKPGADGAQEKEKEKEK